MKKGFSSVYVDDTKFVWKPPNTEVNLGEPTSFLDHVCLGCTQRQCEISRDIVDNYRTMFESRISAGGLEKLPCSENFRISLHGLMMWKVMQRNVWSDTLSLSEQDERCALFSMEHYCFFCEKSEIS